MITPAHSQEGAVRATLDLDGTWQFRMDPEREGAAGKWFEPGVDFPDKIQVPGNWQAQGFGEARNHLRHDYQGLAWYRRTFVVPEEWKGQRVWLHLDGVTAFGDVYVNGRKVGSAEHFLTPFEFDITGAVQWGADNVISCAVDSVSGSHNPHRDPITKPGPVGMFNYWGHWGGLYRPVWLEARADPHIDALSITPDIQKGIARAKVTARRADPGKAWEGKLAVRVTPAKGGETFAAEGNVRFAEGRLESEPVMVDVGIKNARLWSPEDPFLYQASAVLLADGKETDAIASRFGMREISVGEGGTLLLNGQPYFIRGLGDDCVEVLTGTLVPNKGIYMERIKLAKQHGFNAFRFLAHTPPKEVFDAADELGFLIWADAPAYWNHWPRINEVIPLYQKMVPQIIREFQNHPSWYVWSAGNECGANPEWTAYVNYAHKTFKALDPDRLFLASSGIGIASPSDMVTWHDNFGPPKINEAYRQTFNGTVSEVAYFKQALSPAAMASLALPGKDYPDRVKAFDPSGYWRLDEKSVGAVSDSSGNAGDGAYETAMPVQNLDQPGVTPDSNNAVRFGPDAPAINLKAAAESTFARDQERFSVSLFVKPEAFAPEDYGTPFAYGAAEPGKALALSMDGEQGTGRVMIGRWMANVAKSERQLIAGEWNHIGLTYDGEQLQLFINGEPDVITKVRLETELADARIGGSVLWKSAKGQDQPHVWHEFNGNYAGCLPDLSILPKLTGIMQDNDCTSVHVRQIEDYGLTSRYDDIRRKSIAQLQLYLKNAFEAQRKSPTIDGYNLWLLTDLIGGVEGDPPSLGLLDLFYEPKFPNPDAFLDFNNSSVLVIDADTHNRVLAEGESQEVSISLSHYGAKPVTNGKLVWKLKDSDKTIAEGTVDGIGVECGQVREIARIALNSGKLDRAAKLTLDLRLESAAGQVKNEWDFWSFPARKRDFAAAGIANLTGVTELDARYAATDAIQPGQTAVVVANTLDAALLEHVAAGGTAVLLTETGLLRNPLPFRFDADPLRSVGTVVEDAVLENFPQDGFCSYQFVRLFKDSVASLDLTKKGTLEREHFRPLVWGLRADFDPESPAPWPDPRNRTKLYRGGLISETRIGKGRIIVCSLWLLDGIKRSLPEAGYLLDCLVDYALTAPADTGLPALTPEEARLVFKLQAGYLYQTPPSETYGDPKAGKLTDGVRATNSDPATRYIDPAWVGFDLLDGANPVVLTLDLGTEQKVTGITLGFLSANQNGVYSPESFSVSISRDGKDFSPEQSFVTAPEERKEGVDESSSASRELSGVGRYVRVSVGHPTGTDRTYEGRWLFLDEVSVTGAPTNPSQPRDP